MTDGGPDKVGKGLFEVAPIRWDLGGKTGPDLLGRNTIDTAKNRPELHKKAHLKWDRTHATRVGCVGSRDPPPQFVSGGAPGRKPLACAATARARCRRIFRAARPFPATPPWCRTGCDAGS